jgi:hypothetical protein
MTVHGNDRTCEWGHLESCLHRAATANNITGNGAIHESDVQAHGSWVLDRDSAFNNSGPRKKNRVLPLHPHGDKADFPGPQSYSAVLRRAIPTTAETPGTTSSTRIGS